MNYKNYVVCRITTNSERTNIEYFYEPDDYNGKPITDFNKLCPNWVGKTLETHIQAFLKDSDSEQIINKERVQLQ